MSRSIPKRSAQRISTSIRFSGVSPGTEWRWLWISQILKRPDGLDSPSNSPIAPPAQNEPRRTRRLSIEADSRQSEAQDIRAGRDGNVLTPTDHISHGSGFDGVVSRDVPQMLSIFLIDGYQISIRIRVDQNAPGRG